MSNQIQFNTFNFHSNDVRVITDPTGEFWFCGTDVCTILGYINAPDALKKHCKQTGIAKRYISYPSGRKEAIFINEPNLYRLIIKSRKPEAEPFEAWVFEEVLPQIRKTGKYSLEQQQLALPEPEKKFTLNWTENELKRLASFWCAAYEMHQILKHLEQGLSTIGSSFASTVHTQIREYQSTLDLIHARLQVDIDPLQYADPQNAHWQYCLNTINSYKPRAKLIPVRKYNF
ncbi:BRO family protein [Gallibacterium sp. ZY190522]